MRAVFVVVADVLIEQPFQMAFIECDDVAQEAVSRLASFLMSLFCKRPGTMALILSWMAGQLRSLWSSALKLLSCT
jgi:hypothetical protein